MVKPDPFHTVWWAEVQRLYAKRGGKLDITDSRHRPFWNRQYPINTEEEAVAEFMRTHPNTAPPD